MVVTRWVPVTAGCVYMHTFVYASIHDDMVLSFSCLDLAVVEASEGEKQSSGSEDRMDTEIASFLKVSCVHSL